MSSSFLTASIFSTEGVGSFMASLSGALKTGEIEVTGAGIFKSFTLADPLTPFNLIEVLIAVAFLNRSFCGCVSSTVDDYE